MTHALPRSPVQLRDVLYEFALAKEVPDAELLDGFVRQYPEYAEALTEFAVELVVDSLRTEAVKLAAGTSQMSPAVSRAMSRFQNALHDVKARNAASSTQRAAQPPVENLFAKYERKEFRQLAKDLRANLIFACKLRDGLIDARTMTQGFRNFLACAMRVPVEIISAYLKSQRPMVQTGQYCKADNKPQAGGQQTFEEAVQSSELTEEQQRFLLSL